MKNILMTIIMVMVLSVNALGINSYDTFEYYSIPQDGYREIKTGNLLFDDIGIYIVFEDSSVEYLFHLSDEFREGLDTYYRWREVAIENKVTTQRVTKSYNSPAVLAIDGDIHLAKTKIETFIFSQNITNHQFVIGLIGIDISKNPDYLYLDHSQAKDLSKKITKEALEEAREELKNQQQVDDLFE